MEAVGDWRQLAGVYPINIPYAIQDRITKQHATDKERSRVAGEWWVHTDISASWDDLADALYRSGQDKALERVTQYLPKGVYMERILYTVVLIVSVSSATSCSLLD